MTKTPRLAAIAAALVAPAVVFAAGPAAAYVGPGAGVSLFGAVIGLLVAIGAALGVILILPLRALRRRRAAKAAGPGEGGAEASSGPGEGGAGLS